MASIWDNEMNIFEQRKRVMKHIYEARQLLGGDLPRIDVKILELKPDQLGFGYKNTIEISHECRHWREDVLRLVVWHELAHAWFSSPHDEDCLLMRSRTDTSAYYKREKLEAALLRVARN